MILAGDIGGTKTRLAFFTTAGERVTSLVEETFPSHHYNGLDEIVRAFVARRQESITHAGFGVAGPVIHGRSETTNLPWVIDAQQLATQLGLASVALINDLEANAYGVALLETEDFVVLNPGAPDVKGNAAIIAAGTGLGEAGFYWDGVRHHPFACEGGHADFAPRNELEAELLRYLLPQFTHVSYERVVSGPGLYNIYQFLRDTGRGEEPDWLTEELRQQDPAATISQAALTGRSALCMQALDLFVSLYGAEAGNLALKVMATGGLYVGGGIAPKIIRKLQDSTFMQAFTAKGRMQPLLEAMPVRVILNDRTVLLGAARYAMLRALGAKEL
jgi:glucokinase